MDEGLFVFHFGADWSGDQKNVELLESVSLASTPPVSENEMLVIEDSLLSLSRGSSRSHSRRHSKELNTSLATETSKKPKDKLLLASGMQAVADASNDADKIKLIIDKLLLCDRICDFNDESIDGKMRIANKRDILAEVITVLPTIDWTPHFELWDICFQVIAKNLFRSLPDGKMHLEQRDSQGKRTDEEPEFDEDPSFVHLQLVYALLMDIVSNTEANKRMMADKLRGDFLAQLTSLFASPDAREANLVKLTVHAIYARFSALRKEVRRHLSDVCNAYIHASTTVLRSEPWRGIPEIVELFGSFFAGLRRPVRHGFRELLLYVIMPLHKSEDLCMFEHQLMNCVLTFARKDPESVCVLIGGLLRFWPKQRSEKLFIFQQTVMQLLVLVDYFRPDEEAATWLALWESPAFVSMIKKVMDFFTKTMQTPKKDVAEHFAKCWTDGLWSDSLKKFADAHKTHVWPKLYAAVRKNSTDHWVPEVRIANKAVMDGMRTRDKAYFGELEKRYDAAEDSKSTKCSEECAVMRRTARITRWAQTLAGSGECDEVSKLAATDECDEASKFAPSDACDEDSKTAEYCDEEYSDEEYSDEEYSEVEYADKEYSEQEYTDEELEDF